MITQCIKFIEFYDILYHFNIIIIMIIKFIKCLLDYFEYKLIVIVNIDIDIDID